MISDGKDEKNRAAESEKTVELTRPKNLKIRLNMMFWKEFLEQSSGLSMI